MKNGPSDQQSTVLYIPHGGGPLPLLGHPGHEAMVHFLQEITPTLGNPSAIVVISAHWEEDEVTITSGKAPHLIYDYHGFPLEAYDITYPAPGDPALAKKIHGLLNQSSIEARLDDQRGFDHGVFVPLKLMYPDATIPCVQLSLLTSLDSESHIRIGKALSALRNENLLILGSGFSFHNMRAIMSPDGSPSDEKNEGFEDWLIDTCTNPTLSESAREKKLIEWSNAPFARYCHPREEHLLPLHICYGLAGSAGKLVFDGRVINKKTSGYRW